MAKILWQREVDARHDLAVAVMRLCDAPDAMYDHLIPVQSDGSHDYRAPRWRTTMCGCESDAIDLLRYARDSLERHVTSDPGTHGILSRNFGPKWKFRQRYSPDHTILSLASTGPQASDFVRNEPLLLGACVLGCMSAYEPGHTYDTTIGATYAAAATRMLRLWLSTQPNEPILSSNDHFNMRWLLSRCWRKMVVVSRKQVGDRDDYAPVPRIDPEYITDAAVYNLTKIYTRGCSVEKESDENFATVYYRSNYKGWHLFGRSCFNWADAIIDSCQICVTPAGNRELRFDVWHDPGPCGVAWLDKIVEELPTQLAPHDPPDDGPFHEQGIRVPDEAAGQDRRAVPGGDGAG